MSVLTETNQWRIEQLQFITGADLGYHTDLQQYHFGTTRKTEIRDFIINDISSFQNKIDEPWEKFYNDYLRQKVSDLQSVGLDIKTGTPMGLLLALTYSSDVN